MQRVGIRATYEHPALCLDARFGNVGRWIRECVCVVDGSGTRSRSEAASMRERVLVIRSPPGT